MQKFDLDTKPFTFETSTAMAGDLRRRRTVAITALRKDKATQFLQCLYETLKKLANDLVVVERNCKTASGSTTKRPFNNYVDKMRGEAVKKCLFLSTLRV